MMDECPAACLCFPIKGICLAQAGTAVSSPSPAQRAGADGAEAAWSPVKGGRAGRPAWGLGAAGGQPVSFHCRDPREPWLPDPPGVPWVAASSLSLALSSCPGLRGPGSAEGLTSMWGRFRRLLGRPGRWCSSTNRALPGVSDGESTHPQPVVGPGEERQQGP